MSISNKTYLRDGRAPIPKSKNISKVMSANKNKDTKPELMFRKMLYKNRFIGYRLNVKSVVGRPDIFFPKQKIAIFIDGCFWHGCKKCFVIPKTNKRFWKSKIDANKNRDRHIDIKLMKDNIKVIRIWEHELDSEKKLKSLLKYIKTFLNKI